MEGTGSGLGKLIGKENKKGKEERNEVRGTEEEKKR